MLLSCEVRLHSSDFDLESLLSLFLCYRTDAKADADPRYRLSMNRRPSARTVMPGVRVVAMSSSSAGRRSIFERD